MALILIIRSYAVCGQGRGRVKHKGFYLDYGNRLPYLALIISWRFGSVCLEASLLLVFSPYSEGKIRSMCVKHELCR